MTRVYTVATAVPCGMDVDSPVPVDLAIIGGGVAGLSLARAAAMQGARVVLLEQTEGTAEGWRSGGASSLPVALLNPWRGRKGDAHEDDLRGLSVTWRWAAELEGEGLESGALRTGVLRIPSSARQAASWRERCEVEASLTWLPAGSVPAPYHAPFGAMQVEDGGRIDAAAWLTALAASATQHGAQLHQGVKVEGVEPGGKGAWRVRGEDGGTLVEAQRVVSAVGADAPPVVQGVGEHAPWPTWIRTQGEEVRITGVPTLPWPIAGGLYAASVQEGEAWMGGGHRPLGEDDPSAATNLRDAFAWSYPPATEGTIQEVWHGARAKREGARPDVREVAPGLWTFGAFAGRGFLCAADEAERFARRVKPMR